MCADRGITLIELLATLAVALLLISVAVPAFETLLLESRMSSAVNALVRAVHLARVTSHQQVRDVVVCRSADGRRCASGGNWTSGWIVFVNDDGDEPPAVDDGERILQVMQATAVAGVLSNRPAYVLRPMDRRATNGTVTFCDRRGAAAARAVVISYTGRPRIITRTAKGGLLTCPS
jgi:type IV fimbrial biogenesis protein FimT